MQETYSEFISKIITNKKKIESALNIRLINKGKIIFIKGKAENEFIALKVIEAINLGFSAERALLLKDENMLLQVLNIKDITKRNDLETVRARIIGKQGKTLKTLNTLTDCFISLNTNQIGIIGNAEDIEECVQSVISLIQGSKQGNVYARLEKIKKEKRLDEKLHLNETRKFN